ncbi:uncharacterized protein N7477_005371 [Penicillium maclennaniae]|uniref:uncharacterized protein n=1 Tax=Penicillium maclennaniae TaxID=1343394 RepID=UPI0025422A7E|nr:uncharacterized protein N7477_005371 [Penicillium maclennaniae]KAJ5670008.1 hypothetical protein N7477_005371 [Penicillium maclennaniae]
MSSNRNSSDYVGVSLVLVSSRVPHADLPARSLLTMPPEVPEQLHVSIPKSTSTRSLTNSPPVGTASTPDSAEKPPFPSESQDEQKDEGLDSGEPKAKKKNKKKIKKAEQNEGDGRTETEMDGQGGAEDEPSELDVNLGTEPVEELKDEEELEQHTEKHIEQPAEEDEEGDDTIIGSSRPNKSPLLTKEDQPMKDIEKLEPPPLPPKDESASIPSAPKGLSGTLPSVPWGAPPQNKNPPPAAPPPPTRKPSGPFAWFSRSSTGPKELKSPPPQQPGYSRRNTGTSVSTIGSHLDLAPPIRRWRCRQLPFKETETNTLAARMISRVSDLAGLASARAAPAPPIIHEESEDGILTVPAPIPGATSPAIATAPSTINPNLAPGTVSGFSRSATDASTPVDWDMWQQLVNEGPQALVNSEVLNAAIKRGIPQTIRGVIWQILAEGQTGELEDIYRDLVARGTEKDRRSPNPQGGATPEKGSVSSSRSSIHSDHSGSGTQSTSVVVSPSQDMDPERLAKEQTASENARLKKAKDEAVALQKLEKTIRRDLGARTSYSKYFISQGSQESLYGLCKAYALYDEAVGYAQGMNFIVMPLLFNMDEVEAFELLVKLMNKYGLRELFIQDMPGLHRALYQFERLLEDLEPALYCHLRRRGVPPQLYATQWFLTLFAYRFPLQLVLRIYDLIFEEGLESTILKFGIAIMRRNVDALLEMKDMSSLTTFLKERLFDAYIDKQPSASSILESGFFGSSGAADKEIYRADILVQDACAVPLTQDMIKTYTSEWEEKTRTEKEQEAELEYLRHTVATQSARVRLLEERAEASDKEHVQLASELVHVKVENEELRDLNDALKLQVSELKVIVDKQPGEVEEKLRTEMDRIMKRNIEVQNENRAIEDHMAEMEKELVATKMKWAEMSENHETLRQKWSDLRRALD